MSTFVEQTTAGGSVIGEQELVPFVSEQIGQPVSRNHLRISRRRGSNSGPAEVVDIATNAPALNDDIRKGEPDVLPENAGPLVVSTSAISSPGSSLFQGLIERARRTVHGSAVILVGYNVVQICSSRWNCEVHGNP